MRTLDVLDATRELQQFLATKPWRYALIGGLALNCRAEARATQDVDISLICEIGAARDWIDPLLEAFRPRIPDAVDFAMQNGVLLLSASNGIGLDIGLTMFPFEAAMIDRATTEPLAVDLRLPVVTAEDLVIMKCLAGRPQDWADVYNLIRHAESLDWEIIGERLQSISELFDYEEVSQQLQKLRNQASRTNS